MPAPSAVSRSPCRAGIAGAIQTILDGGSFTPNDSQIGHTRAEEINEDAELYDAMRCRFEPLTNQQWKVLELMAQGLPNKQIAYAIDVQLTTVKAHVSSLLQKFGVSRRAQAVILYQKYYRQASLSDRGTTGAHAGWCRGRSAPPARPWRQCRLRRRPGCAPAGCRS